MNTEQRESFTYEDGIKALIEVKEYFVKRFSDLKGEDVRDLGKFVDKTDKVIEFLENQLIFQKPTVK